MKRVPDLASIALALLLFALYALAIYSCMGE